MLLFAQVVTTAAMTLARPKVTNSKDVSLAQVQGVRLLEDAIQYNRIYYIFEKLCDRWVLSLYATDKQESGTTLSQVVIQFRVDPSRFGYKAGQKFCRVKVVGRVFLEGNMGFRIWRRQDPKW